MLIRWALLAHHVLCPNTVDNPGAPVLPSGEPLYEIIRDDTGDGWEIREARVSTVLGSWNNVTLRPWYR